MTSQQIKRKTCTQQIRCPVKSLKKGIKSKFDVIFLFFPAHMHFLLQELEVGFEDGVSVSSQGRARSWEEQTDMFVLRKARYQIDDDVL